jgi:DNA invertase Pin-like site-specific DNA recombinase
MSVTTYRPWGQTEGKIRPEHHDRMAVIYIRQSTAQQVLEHSESTRLQYALTERAVALGWARSRIVVLDDDLGCSAAVADTRPGFAKLVTEVTMGRVGIVVGMEMSRLARTGQDWHKLLELCSLTGTLLADPDGVYDPGHYNDRLLLGLKGTMSEAELYLIKQRMNAGRLAKAQRGELPLALPTGYMRRTDGQVVLDPDEQVQHVVRLVFDAFDRLGTVGALLRHLVDHDVRLPMRTHGAAAEGRLQWRRPNRETLYNMLHNPAYAGYYAYGRRRVDPRRKVPGHPNTGLVAQPRDEWLVVLPDRLPAYLTVERYEANLARLAANRPTAATPGHPREGSALLAGLLYCGRCGGRRRMRVHYPTDTAGQVHDYTCAFEQLTYGTGRSCQHLAGAALDRYVTGEVLTALAPAALEVSLQAAAHAEAERAALDTLWHQRLERARYTAERAGRQYNLAEPENRLVVRQLERDWEAALADLDRLRANYQRFADTHPKTLTGAEREAIRTLAEDLPAVWAAPSTTNADRKQLLRLLIDKVTVAVVGDSELVDVTITWAGGHRTSGQATRPVARLDQLSYYPRLTRRVTDLAGQGHTARQIAAQLNAEGLRPPKRATRFGADQVLSFMTQLGIHGRRVEGRPATAGLGTDEWTVHSLAATLGMPPDTVYKWIYRGWVTARREPHDGSCWVITADPAEIQRLRELHARPWGYHTRQRWARQSDQPTSEEET